MGPRLDFGAVAWRVICRAHDLALDLLHQLPVLRHRVYHNTLSAKTARRAAPNAGAAPEGRLVWIGSVHCQHNQLFNWFDLGWFRISLVKLADAGPNNHWHCRGFGDRVLGTLLGFQPFSASRAFQILLGNRCVLMRGFARPSGETSLPL